MTIEQNSGYVTWGNGNFRECGMRFLVISQPFLSQKVLHTLPDMEKSVDSTQCRISTTRLR